MLKTYEVTVAPKMTSYAGTWADSGYTVRVTAKDRNEAISMVRRQRRNEDGRYAVACTYTAKRAEAEVE